MPSTRRKQQPKPPSPIFFLDRNLGRSIANAIHDQGYKALRMSDIYPDGSDQHIPDPYWMKLADKNNWVVLTKDYSLMRDHSDILATSSLRIFAFNNANISGTELVNRLKFNFNRILQRVAKPGPYVYVIASKGLERRWSPP